MNSFGSTDLVSGTSFYKGMHSRRLSVSVLGQLDQIEVSYGTLSMLIILAAVIFIELIFHRLHALTAETPFKDIITAIEKELMVVGGIAFILKCIINSSSTISGNWVIAIEFIDILVPITSLLYCSLGAILTILAVIQFRFWRRAYRMCLLDQLNGYYDSFLLPTKDIYAWFRSRAIYSDLELRLYEVFFCEEFRIHREAFKFDDYLEKVVEKYLENLLEVKPLCWAAIAVIALLNWARLALDITFVCAAEDYGCDVGSSLKVFSIVGAIMTLVTAVIAVVSYYYKRAILRSHNISTIREYGDHLLNCVEDHASGHYLIGESLEDALYAAKAFEVAKNQKQFRDRASRSRSFMRFMYNLFHMGGLSKEPISSHSMGPSKVPVAPHKINGRDDINTKQSSSSGGGGGAEANNHISIGILGSQVQVLDSRTPISVESSSRAPISLWDSQPSSAVMETRQQLEQQQEHLRHKHFHLDPMLEPIQEGDDGNAQDDDEDEDEGLKDGNIDSREEEHNTEKKTEVEVEEDEEEGQRQEQRRSSALAESLRNGNGNKKHQRLPGAIVLEIDSTTTSAPLPAGEGGGEGSPHTHTTPEQQQETRHRVDRVHPPTSTINDTTRPPPSLLSRQYSSGSRTSGGGVLTGGGIDHMVPPPSPVAGGSSSSSTQPLNFRPLSLPFLQRQTSFELSSFGSPREDRSPSIGGTRNDRSHSIFTERSRALSSASAAYPQSMRKLFSKSQRMNSIDLGAKIAERYGDTLVDVAEWNLPIQNGQFKKGLFLWDKPHVYFAVVNGLMMIISFYIGVWLTNYDSAANEVTASNNWRFYSIFPGIVSAALFVYIVHCVCIIKAVAIFDRQALVEVLQEEKENGGYVKTAREAMLRKLSSNMGIDAEFQLAKLFADIDLDNCGSISHHELNLFMVEIGVILGKRSRHALFKSIHRNYSEEITFEELFFFLFPDHHHATAAESERLNALEQEVYNKSRALREKISSAQSGENPLSGETP